MRISAPVTDYVPMSILTTQGDLIARGAIIPERFAAGVLGTYLQGKGAGVLPAYEKTMPPMSFQGDMLYQGGVNPERLGPGITGNVLQYWGPTKRPIWSNLFNLLTTQGDLWVRGAADPQRIAAGLLDTYFKGQGAGELPIYEKMSLKDTGIKIGNGTRNTSGDQVITGVGFRPSTIIFLCVAQSGSFTNEATGFSNGTVDMCMYLDVDAHYAVSTAYLAWIEPSAGSYFNAVVNTLSADGFTITWVRAGAPPRVDFVYLCLP